MAPGNGSCLFCKKRPWDAKELELLDWYSVNLNGRLDTRICYFHIRKQGERLPNVRRSIQEEGEGCDVATEKARLRVCMEHYLELQSVQEETWGCCSVM